MCGIYWTTFSHGDKGWSPVDTVFDFVILAVFTLLLAFWIIENFFYFLEFHSGQVDTSICVLILLIGSDPSEINLKNAEKINQIAGSLQSDNERRGSSAAESQGMAQKYICQGLALWGVRQYSGDHPPTKKPEDYGYQIVMYLAQHLLQM